MARFTQPTTGEGSGLPGPQGDPGPQGNAGADGSDGLDSLFLGTWNSVTEFLAAYQGGPTGLADGDWWAFVKDNENPNKIYVVREDPNSATGWVIDDNEHFDLPQGPQGDPGADGADGSDGAQGDPGLPGADGADALWNYTGEYNGGASYAVGDIATYDGQLWYRYNSNGGNVGDTPSPGLWNLLAAKGADGADGATGATGSQGLYYLGNYVSGNGYVANLAVVKGSDNNLYIATSSGGLGDPVGNSAEWSIFLPKGVDGDPLDFLNVASNIVPTQSNFYTLGTTDKRWADVYLGPSTINIIDQTLGTNASIAIDNGVFFINGIAQAQLPYLAVTNLTFADDTTQTTAAVAQIQSDWTQTDNTELDYIKNKPTLPDLSGYGVPTSYSPVWSGTGLTYTGTPATGSYMKMGKMVTFRIKVNCATVAGASNSGFGSGQYSLTLPFAPVTDYVFRDGGIHHIGGPAHYQMSGDAEPGTTQLTLWYTASQGQDQAMDYNSPHALQTPDHFYISGTYECQ